MLTINLTNRVLPFRHTPEGQNLLYNLQVNLQAVDNRDRVELIRFAYCIAAGACKSDNVDFDYTIDQFITACEFDWREKVEQLLNEQSRDAACHVYNEADETIETIEAIETPETPEEVETVKKPETKKTRRDAQPCVCQ